MRDINTIINHSLALRRPGLRQAAREMIADSDGNGDAGAPAKMPTRDVPLAPVIIDLAAPRHARLPCARA